MNKSTENINKAKLALKLVEISALMVGIQKDGKNQQQKFSYIGYEQVNALLSKYMLDKKVVIIPEINESEKSVYEYQDRYKQLKRVSTVNLKATFEIIDCETGYTMIKKWEGEASDYNDKAFSKASTEIQKRFYAKLFNITSGEADADQETIEIKNNNNQQNNYQNQQNNNNYSQNNEKKPQNTQKQVKKEERKLTPVQEFDSKIGTWTVKDGKSKKQKRDIVMYVLDMYGVRRVSQLNQKDFDRFDFDIKTRFALSKVVLTEFEMTDYREIKEGNLVKDYWDRIEDLLISDNNEKMLASK